MVVKKSYIIITAVILGLCTPITFADSENNLVQLDLKRSSDSSVDVTLVTSNNYGENVLVRKKSDNKYVILIPKVQSSGYRASKLLGVQDLVQNIDVKTVNDTSGGYTKVTLITTKPLDIKTRTSKSVPLTSEQQEYNSLISQANAVRNTISTKEPPKIREQKVEVTVNKAPQEVKTAAKEQPKVKTEIVKKPEVKLTEVAPENIERYNRKAHLAELKNEVKMEKALEEIPDVVPETPIPVVNNDVKEITELPVTPKVSLLSKIKGKIKRTADKIPSKLPKSVGAILLAGLAVFMISKLGKKSQLAVNDSSLIDENIQSDSNLIRNYDNITNNRALSWREKYKLYLDKSATPVPRANNKGKYTFIKKPSVSAINKKRAELEKMLNANVNNYLDFEGLNIEPEIVESEDNSIHNTIKLKAFGHSTNSLKTTSRYMRSRFKKYENEIPLHEQKTIELDETPLYANRRNLKSANLKVSDVDSRRITYEPKDYIMSSVDEYLSILDSETKNTKTQEIQTPVAQIEETPKNIVSNPISNTKNKEYFKGTIVKSSYKIGDDKGIYLINKNGKNSLVGKVNDKVFVLKKFDGNITNPMQVRHDNANVYMVKAGGFKSLVEVNDDKMGVLIEL